LHKRQYWYNDIFQNTSKNNIKKISFDRILRKKDIALVEPILRIIIYTRSGYEVFCNLIGSLLAGY
jgi:hypothetical protein